MNKTLVCVIGQTRAHEISWKSFKHHVLDELRADLLLCIHFSGDYDFANPLWQFSKYRSCHPDLSDWGEGFDEAQDYELSHVDSEKRPNWRELLSLPGILFGGVKGSVWESGSSSILIYYRWLLAKYILSEGLLEKYDRFILTRSDYIWECPHPPMSVLDSGNIWIPEGEQYRGVTDRHTILSRENIIDYLNLIQPIITEPHSLMMEMAKGDHWNLEGYLKFYLDRVGLFQKVKHFPYVMYAARPWGGSSTVADHGTWSDQLGYYVKYPHEYGLATAASKIIKSKNDWLKLFSNGHDEGLDCVVLNEDQKTIGLRQNENTNQLYIDPLLSINGPLLTIDYKNSDGYLYLWQSNRDICNKQLVDEIKLIEVNDGKYHFQSIRDGMFYYLMPDGLVVRDMAKASIFTMVKRYNS